MKQSPYLHLVVFPVFRLNVRTFLFGFFCFWTFFSGGRCRLVSNIFLTKSFDEELFFYRSDEGLTLETSPF